MSIDNLGVDNSIPDESGVAQLISHFVGLFEAQQKQIDELEDEVDELREHSAQDRAEIRKDVENVREEAESGSKDPSGEDDAPDSPETPIERVSALDDQDHGIEVTPSVRRATVLYEHLRDWAVKTPRGFILKTKNGLRNLLSAATEENLSWKLVYRACEALDDLAKGDVEYYEDHPRHGKMLVIPNDGHGQSSSVAT